jgi:type IV secretion system protein VirD4
MGLNGGRAGRSDGDRGRAKSNGTVRFVIHAIRNLDASVFLLFLAKADILWSAPSLLPIGAFMSGTRVLWGQVAIVLSIVLTAIWCATEWTAWRLGFQAQLGSPGSRWRAGRSITRRLLLVVVLLRRLCARIFIEGAYIAASGGFISIAVAIAMSVWRAREAKNVVTYGSARWAEPEEIRAAGLLGADGVVLGRYDRDYLRHDGPEHVLCFAPTRSGKGVGLVVPTLLTWPGSAIVHDIKGENWTLTAGFRSRHGRVLLFDPTNPASSAYNPLLEVRRGEWEVRDVQNIADILVDPEGALEKRNHWEKTSHSLLVGAILHVLYAEPDKTLAGVANFLSDPAPDRGDAARDDEHAASGRSRRASVIASSARELLNKSDNERSGVLSTAMSFLGLYRDPVVAKVTARCDWRIADLVAGDSPSALSRRAAVRHQPHQAADPPDAQSDRAAVDRRPEDVGKRHRLLLMLDEFPALGRLDFFESALAFMAGYGIKSFLIAQSLNQIEKAYGANNSVLDNCHVRVAFATNDERTAKRVSDALGTATEMRDEELCRAQAFALAGHLMVSRQETARPLLTPGEVMQLPPADELLHGRGRAADPGEEGALLRGCAVPRTHPAAAEAGRGEGLAKPLTNDWSALAIPAASADEAPESASGMTADPANGGIRREPELPEHEEIAPPEQPALGEFDLLDDEPDLDAAKARRLRLQARSVARQAALDPTDGIEL